MTSRQQARPSTTQNTDKCIHTASSTGMCQCKTEMENKFGDFKKLTGDIFKKQLQEQLNEKTKKLRNFSDTLLRENVKLKKDNDKVDVLQKLHDNVSRQVSLQETIVDKQKVDISKIQSTVDGLTEHNKELQVTVDGLTEHNKELQVTVDGLTEHNKKLQITVGGLTKHNKELQVSELKAAIEEIQNRMKVVEDKIQ